jgi:hypothetical protein
MGGRRDRQQRSPLHKPRHHAQDQLVGAVVAYGEKRQGIEIPQLTRRFSMEAQQQEI